VKRSKPVTVWSREPRSAARSRVRVCRRGFDRRAPQRL